MAIQNDDDNSQSTYTPGMVRSSMSIDNVTDNDSNLTANQPDDYEPGKHFFKRDYWHAFLNNFWKNQKITDSYLQVI
jgi:hypothetical protein